MNTSKAVHNVKAFVPVQGARWRRFDPAAPFNIIANKAQYQL